MSKIALVKKKKEKYVYVKLMPNQMINAREIQLLNQGQVMQLINPEVKSKGKTELFYKLSGYISLREYLQSVTPKERFLNIVISILEMLKESQELFLYNKNFIMDVEYIFVEPQSKIMKYIYLPVVNYENEPNIKGFFNNLAFETVFNQLEDCSYVKEYISYFNNNANFSIYDFEMFIREMNGEEVRSGDRNRVNQKNNQPIAHPSKYLELNSKYCSKCGREYTSMDNFCDLCGSRLVFSDNKPKNDNNSVIQFAEPVSMQNVQNNVSVQNEYRVPYSTGTTVLGASEYGTTVLGEIEGGTTVLSAEELNAVVYPHLIRVRDNSKISVNKTVFSMGKSENGNDYIISDNSAISRNHVLITISNGEYFVKDLGSTNGTYIDDVRIEKEVDNKIQSGQKLRLANDEFEFIV